MKISELQKEVHENAKDKGWWDDGDRNPLEICALIHSEVSEAVEDFRKETPFCYQMQNDEQIIFGDKKWINQYKPEGPATELADAIIRCLDYAGRMEWDLEGILIAKHEFNKTRPHRHGNKRY